MNTRKEIDALADNLCGIYKIISPSDKIYIGQSRNIKNRLIKYFRFKGETLNNKLKKTNIQRKLLCSFKKYIIYHVWGFNVDAGNSYQSKQELLLNISAMESNDVTAAKNNMTFVKK